MRKTEVYQVRLDSQEKKQAFAVFKQLGISPAQAVRLFQTGCSYKIDSLCNRKPKYKHGTTT